ncbi:hypothetical protein BJY00DRAFT_28065 [Aspergillus carlsbadensis]|nr:hypothetical protein BJY00DRAFT_28065 [Aspergillus carlsbadensis]
MWMYQRTYRGLELGLHCLQRSTMCGAFSFLIFSFCLYNWGVLPFCCYCACIFSFCSIISLWVLYNFIGVVRLVSGRHFEIVVFLPCFFPFSHNTSPQRCFPPLKAPWIDSEIR